MSVVKLQNIEKTYPLGKQEVHAVKGISLEIEKGEFASISGPSGSGKSTLLNMIGLIDTPTAGEIIIDGKNIYEGIDLGAKNFGSGRKGKAVDKELQLSAVHTLVSFSRLSTLFRFSTSMKTLNSHFF